METDTMNDKTPSYWPSVAIASLVTALMVTALSIMGGYMTINSEPTGAIFNSSQIFGIVSCFVGAVGGVLVNWHYANEYEITYNIGKGALLGLLVGILASIFSVILGQLWYLIDGNYMKEMMDWSMANIDAMNIPEDAKMKAMEGFDNPNSMKNILIGTGVTILGLGVINIISGLIGAKLFASEE